MKRFLTLCLAMIGLSLCSMANPVDFETVKAVAAKFMKTEDLQLTMIYRTDSNVAAFYVFNTTDGFVIVSADDCETPIIGYSHEGRFDPNNVPIQMEDFFQDFVARIQYGIENQLEADEATARQWELVKAEGRLNESRSAKAVPALLTSQWHQGCLYNSLCPTLSGPCDHAEVGCVAVAMGQIMRYWGYPSTGWGTHSYSNLGVQLSADFGNTTYDWEQMPDSLTDASSEEEIEAVATLLYHCGVAVGMMYSNNGSNANTSDVVDALRLYFNYSKQAHKEKKSNYSDEEWRTLLTNNLDLGRPIQYVGFGSGGHSFVCDGYDNDGLFHFNWGWGVANGYYALGNMNPNGYNFSNDNYALFDIVPQYEPCLVYVTAFPSNAGTITGAGEYHVEDSCTVTATFDESHQFYCWKKNGQIVSCEPSYTFSVEEDTTYIEAYFSCLPVGQITANYDPEANNPNSTSVNLSWSRADTDWVLLKQIDAEEECSGVVTDGEHIYVTYGEWNQPDFAFGKYTMDGELVEKFNLGNGFNAVGLAYDGTSFYCNCSRSGLQIMYRIDLYNKTVIDSTDMGIWFGDFTYDPGFDGFWLGRNYKEELRNRQGQLIQTTPSAPDYVYGTGYYTAEDGSPHLLLSREPGIYDYDITNNAILDRPLLDPGWDYTYGVGAFIAKYNGKDAMFINNGYSILIYEIKSRLAQIVGYRIYRSDNEGHTVMLADEIDGSSYLDLTWNSTLAGEYRFGISEVYFNGVESEIIWSEPIIKTDYGIDENDEEEPEQTVQKIFEDGHIVIIKDGKRYSVSGQRLN
jgi:hypothetical protein